MSDELFPDEGADKYEYDDNEDDGENIIKKIKDKIELPEIPGLSGDGEDEEKDSESSALPDDSVSFLESEEEESEEDTVSRVVERVDRFTVLLVTVEIVLVLYLAAAILGLVPFF
jgi:hypothetical protein